MPDKADEARLYLSPIGPSPLESPHPGASFYQRLTEKLYRSAFYPPLVFDTLRLAGVCALLDDADTKKFREMLAEANRPRCGFVDEEGVRCARPSADPLLESSRTACTAWCPEHHASQCDHEGDPHGSR